jgi:hypothetical protein
MSASAFAAPMEPLMEAAPGEPTRLVSPKQERAQEQQKREQEQYPPPLPPHTLKPEPQRNTHTAFAHTSTHPQPPSAHDAQCQAYAAGYLKMTSALRSSLVSNISSSTPQSASASILPPRSASRVIRLNRRSRVNRPRGEKRANVDHSLTHTHTRRTPTRETHTGYEGEREEDEEDAFEHHPGAHTSASLLSSSSSSLSLRSSSSTSCLVDASLVVLFWIFAIGLTVLLLSRFPATQQRFLDILQHHTTCMCGAIVFYVLFSCACMCVCVCM